MRLRFLITLILTVMISISQGLLSGVNAQVINHERAFFDLNFEGKIINEGVKKMEVTAVIYNENRKVEATEVLSNGTIPLSLGSGRRYMIEIKAPGYYVHRIGINTEIDEQKREIPNFPFNIKLVEIKEGETDGALDADLIDFPAALISFNVKKQAFVYDRNYSKQFKLERKNAGLK